ncbi:MAG: hypothetical protein IJF17_13525 [Thermoguttaceae bacterium]|nr:hypothetical protein [Thermoguttaceae bacterium]
MRNAFFALNAPNTNLTEGPSLNIADSSACSIRNGAKNQNDVFTVYRFPASGVNWIFGHSKMSILRAWKLALLFYSS